MPAVPATLPARPPRESGMRALLRRLSPLVGSAGSNAAAPTRIGIEGLPQGVNQMPSQMPVSLVAADDSGAALWFPALLEDAVTAGPVGWVAPSAEWADQLLLRPPLREAYRSGRLLLWVLAPGVLAQVKRDGLSSLMNELARTGLKRQHALYIGDAQPLLRGLSVAQLARVSAQLSTLCRERSRPVVLGFFQHTALDVLLPTLRQLCPRSMHIATLRTDADRWQLGLERWNSDAGALFQTAFGLVHDAASGRLTADGTRTQGVASALVEAVDPSDVIATRASVDGQHAVPSHWRMVDGLADIEAAAASSVAATVLLDAGQAGDFEALARLVHRLRLSRPLTLKIVVRENLSKLRLHSEQALLQLGASAVAPKEMAFSRLLQLLQDINAQRHTREVDPDFEQALAGFLPTEVSGYQPPARFCHLVRDTLERTRSSGLPHSLVQLNLLPQTPHWDALRACQLSRDGDVFTADHEAVYVFLFACREPDVGLTLNRLFTLPLTQLFASEAMDCSNEGIRSMTDRLQESARQGVPDHSALLNSRPASQQTATAATPMAAARAPSAVTSSATTLVSIDPADPLATPQLHHATRPRMQPRPIARRVVPPAVVRSAA